MTLHAVHVPRHGDDIDAWLRWWDDQFPAGSPEERAIGLVWADYQDHADTGARLVKEQVTRRLVRAASRFGFHR